MNFSFVRGENFFINLALFIVQSLLPHTNKNVANRDDLVKLSTLSHTTDIDSL